MGDVKVFTINGFVTRDNSGLFKFHMGSVPPVYVHDVDAWVTRKGGHMPIVPLYPGDPTAELIMSQFGFLKPGGNGCSHVNIRMEFHEPTPPGKKRRSKK